MPPQYSSPSSSSSSSSSSPTFRQRIHRWRRLPIGVAITVSLAIFVDMLCYGVIVPLAPDLLANMVSKDSITTINGVLLLVYAAGLVIASIVGTWISDHYRTRKLPMCVGLAGLIVCTIFFAIGTQLWHLVLARVGQGLAAGVTVSIGMAMLSEAYHPSRHGTVMGTSFAFHGIGMLGGLTLGGILYEKGGVHAPFIFVAVLAAIDLAARLFVMDTLHNDELQKVPETETLHGSDERSIQTSFERAAIKEKAAETAAPSDLDSPVDAVGRTSADAVGVGVSVGAGATADAAADADEKDDDNVPGIGMLRMAREPAIIRCLLVAIAIGSSFAAIDTVLPVQLEHAFGLSPQTIGFVFLALILPDFFMSPLVGWFVDRYHERVPRMLVSAIGLLGMGATLPLAAVAGSIWLECVLLVVSGLTTAVSIVPVMPELTAILVTMEGGTNCAARLYGLFSIAFSVGMIVAPYVAGAVFDKVGGIAALGVFGAFCGLIAIVLLVDSYIALQKCKRDAARTALHEL
ncbi:MFS general substrate transporter [Ramicandelaber brevisporus]|nr:MFS general substrate transporter [Ramicandelaber brevisporus]